MMVPRLRRTAFALALAWAPQANAQAPAPVSEAVPESASAETPAESPDDAPESPGSMAPKTLDAAREAGYASRPEDEPAGSLLGGLLAVGPGFLVHGVGHYYVDDIGTAWRLLVGEVLGVALVAGGAALQAYTGDAGATGALQRLMVHAGAFLFVGTWLTDIVGTFKGAESFDPDTTRTEGHVLSLAYRYRADPQDPRHHHLVAGLELDFGLVYLRPETTLDAALAERDWVVDTGVRVWRGLNPQNNVALGLRGRRLEYPAHGYAVRSGELYLRWKADLGQMIRSMRGFYLTNRLGLGLEEYQFADTLGRTPGLFDASDFQSGFFTVASGAEVNTGRRTHVGAMYVQDPTGPVAAASAETGALDVFLRHRYRDDLEIDVDVFAGDGWVVWLGLAYGL
jgi:hypothetical protein